MQVDSRPDVISSSSCWTLSRSFFSSFPTSPRIYAQLTFRRGDPYEINNFPFPLCVTRRGELAQLQLSSFLVVFQRCFHSHSVRPANFRSFDCYFLFSILPLSLQIVSSGTLIARVCQFRTYLHTSPNCFREIAQFLPLDVVKYFLSLRNIIFERSADRCENIFGGLCLTELEQYL